MTNCDNRRNISNVVFGFVTFTAFKKDVTLGFILSSLDYKIKLKIKKLLFHSVLFAKVVFPSKFDVNKSACNFVCSVYNAIFHMMISVYVKNRYL